MSMSLVEVLRAEHIGAAALFAGTVEALLAQLATALPDVVLLDLDLGPLGDGLELVAPIAQMGAEVVILTGSRDAIRHAACLEAGAAGIVSKDVDLDELLDAVGKAARGEPLVTAERRASALSTLRRWRAHRDRQLALFRSLTPREVEILASMRLGMSVAVMAEEFDVAPTTIRSHIRSVLVKLGVTSQLEAVAFAREAGWNPR